MTQPRSGQFLLALVGMSLANAGTARAVDVAPHRALYSMSLASAKQDSGVVAVEGTMSFQWGETCDAWTVEQRYKMKMRYAEDSEVELTSSFVTVEAKDGTHYRFWERKLKDGEPDEEVRGEASLAGPGLGGTAEFSNGDLAAAKAKFEEALKSKPDDPELANNLGLTLERTGQLDAAIARYTQAVQLNGRSWAYHFNLAHAVSVRQEWDRAIAEYRIARDLFPADYATQYNLAITLHRKGDEAAAIPEFEKAIALAPTEASFHLALGASLEKAGRLSDAKREYQQYVDMAPSATDADQVRAHLQGLL